MFYKQLLKCAVFCAFSTSLVAQQDVGDFKVLFSSNSITPPANISQIQALSKVNPSEVFNQRIYRFVQFNSIPDASEHAKIKKAGIKLLEYIPNKLYFASIPVQFDWTLLSGLNVRSVFPIERAQKVHPRLDERPFPSWANKGLQVGISINYPSDIKGSLVLEQLQSLGASIDLHKPHSQMVFAYVSPFQLNYLAQQAYVRTLDLIPDPGTAESDDGRNLHGSSGIDVAYAGGRKYNGDGVTIAINDDGYVGPHIDFAGRLNQQNVANDFTGDHGDMVAGIAGGAGNLNPIMRGMATHAYMHIRRYSGQLPNTVQLHQDSGIVVFSSSYGNGCNSGYTSLTQMVDQEIVQNPSLIQTFSAGNSGNSNCGYGAGAGWGNITGGHKIGKNVIAVANLYNNNTLVPSSSRGPSADGRIKPDIAAHGQGQMSTDPNNAYASGGGTSAAAPGVAGVLAQLHQAYRSLNSGAQASSALLKAVLLNSAIDLGNSGPDYRFGWGKVNALGAVKILEDNRYFAANVAQGDSNLHTIAIPAGTQEARIMVYWMDKEASPSASKMLVNNLDATLSPSAGGSVYRPSVLDPTPNATSLLAPAQPGYDDLNNMEQIILRNPSAGNYTLKVKGETVPFTNQEYYVIMEYINDDVTILYPAGGEGLVPNKTTRIQWQAAPSAFGYTLEYSVDNGQNWSSIGNAGGTTSYYDWVTPNTITGQALVRITRNSKSTQSAAGFSIIDTTTNIKVSRICPTIGSLELEWDNVANATSYVIYKLGNKFMDSIGTSTTNTFLHSTDVTQPGWYSVHVNGANGAKGMRSVAIYFQGTNNIPNGDCSISCLSDDDAGVSTLLHPTFGDFICDGPTQVPVEILLENLGISAQTNFTISYKVNNNPIVSETYTANLAAGSTPNFTFNQKANFTGVKDTLWVWVNLPGDSTICNDTLIEYFDRSNTLLSVFPYAEPFATATLPSNLEIINPDNSVTWEVDQQTQINNFSGNVLKLSHWTYSNANNERDYIQLPYIDLSLAQTASLKFDHSYRYYNNTNVDTLVIELSQDCGQTFQTILQVDGKQLSGNQRATRAWEPGGMFDWDSTSVSLDSFVGKTVLVRIGAINDYGNNMYLDNINVNIVRVPLSVPTLTAATGIQAYPNPAFDKLNVQFPEALNEQVTLTITNLQGQILREETVSIGTLTHQVSLDRLSSALYFINISGAKHNETIKVIKQ